MSEHEEQIYKAGYAKGYADAKKNEKHGRWIKITYPGCVAYKCSACGDWGYYGHKHCPECGAIMDLPNITENTRKALEKMGENVHSDIDFDYAAEDE